MDAHSFLCEIHMKVTNVYYNIQTVNTLRGRTATYTFEV